MEDTVFLQANLVNVIVSHISILPFIYPPQVCQETTYAPITTPIPHAAPMIAPIVQTDPESNAATDAASTIIPQILTIMQQIQQLNFHIQSNQAGGGSKKKCNSRCPSTHQAATEPRQGQPHKQLPYFVTKYFWTHGKWAHEGAACNKKYPKHRDTATLCK